MPASKMSDEMDLELARVEMKLRALRAHVTSESEEGRRLLVWSEGVVVKLEALRATLAVDCVSAMAEVIEDVNKVLDAWGLSQMHRRR